MGATARPAGAAWQMPIRGRAKAAMGRGGSHGHGHGAAIQVFKFRSDHAVIARVVAVAAMPVREVPPRA